MKSLYLLIKYVGVILKNSIKPAFSASNIGIIRFYIGIAVGLMFGMTLCLFLNYTREMCRYSIGYFRDLIYLNPSSTLFFDAFFASFSMAIGFSMTVWFWMSGIRNTHRKQRLFHRLSQVNATLGTWVTLMLLTRIGSILFLILYTQRGYESDLMLTRDFKLLFLALPVIIFFQNWISIRKYRTNQWMLYSFMGYLGASFMVYLLGSVDTKIVDANYAKRYELEYTTIESELDRASSKFDIVYQPSTIKALKEWYTVSSREQVAQVKAAFESNNNVSADTIILQRIIIKNSKEGGLNTYHRSTTRDWPYARPIDIYKQMMLNKNDSAKLGELAALLNEQIELINYSHEDMTNTEVLSGFERRKQFRARHDLPKEIVTEMIDVSRMLERMSEEGDIVVSLKEILF